MRSYGIFWLSRFKLYFSYPCIPKSLSASYLMIFNEKSKQVKAFIKDVRC